MCIVSNISDYWQRNLLPMYPSLPVQPSFPIPEISRIEFEALKLEVAELKKLLTAAKEFDEATGQLDCEMEQKVKFLKQIASAVGVSMDDVFPKEAK